MDPFLGEIYLMTVNFDVKYFHICDGKELTMSQNNALYTLFGTAFGGNGRTTFALPDLRGRIPTGQGQGPGLSVSSLGYCGTQETCTLESYQIPLHNHNLLVNSKGSTETSPSENVVLANGPQFGSGPEAFQGNIYSEESPDVALFHSIGAVGNQQSFSLLQPFQVLNYQIATSGIYPQRA